MRRFQSVAVVMLFFPVLFTKLSVQINSTSGKELNEYRIGGNLYIRYPGIYPPGYKPTPAFVRADDSIYNKLLEDLIQVHYEGWQLDKLYVHGSMKDSRVTSRDAKGRPTEITGTYTASGGWTRSFTVLITEEQPYAIFESADPAPGGWAMACILPFKRVNGRNEPYSLQERIKFQNLQKQYLIGVWTKKFEEVSRESNQLSFLKSAVFAESVPYKTEVEEQEVVEDKDGNPIGTRPVKVMKDLVNYVSVPGIKNESDDYLIVKNYDLEQTANTITIVDHSFWLRPGEIIRDFKINTKVNNTQDLNLKTPLNKIGNVEAQKVTPVSTSNSKMPKRISAGKIEVNSYTSNSDIRVREGETVTIKAEGIIRVAPPEWVQPCGPDGATGYIKYDNMTKFKPGALIGKIGEQGAWFLIGSEKTFVAPATGLLILAINDNAPDDNEGSFQVEYHITPK